MNDVGIRIQKALAQAGIGSRRQCDALVAAGRVTVNGAIADLGTRVDPVQDRIALDGQPVGPAQDIVIYAFHKPAGVVTTMADDRGKACVGDYVEHIPQRLFHVGRLDEATEGLLLLTNDGDLANLLTHPSHGVQKTYVATVRGQVTQADLDELTRGVVIDEGKPAVADRVRVLSTDPDRLELIIHEGRKHVVRRMCKGVGHPVLRLMRTRIGALEMGDLRAGELRQLRPDETQKLLQELHNAK